MPTWPTDLPQEFEARGYSDRLPERLVRSQLDAGEPKTRERARRGYRIPISGQMLMDSDQWNDLLSFYETDLADGALAFDFPNVDGEVIEVEDPNDPTMTIPDPDGALVMVSVAFAEPPSVSAIGPDFFTVRLSLEQQS